MKNNPTNTSTNLEIDSYNIPDKKDEDQLFYELYQWKDAELVMAIIADGVSTSDIGRFAAISICSIIKNIFDKEKENILPLVLQKNFKAFEDFIVKNILNQDEIMSKMEANNYFKEIYEHKIKNQEIDEYIKKNLELEAVTSDPKQKEKLKEWRKQIESDKQNTTSSNKKPEDQLKNIIDPISKIKGKDILTKKEITKYNNKFMQAINIAIENDKKYKNFESITTLSLAFIISVDDTKCLISFCLGDSEIRILSKNFGFIEHYVSHLDRLGSYISTQKGIYGRLDIATRYLNDDDIVIIFSDGANVSRTPLTGEKTYQNMLKEYLDSKKSLEGFSQTWLEYFELTDDASLINIRVISKKVQTSMHTSNAGLARELQPQTKKKINVKTDSLERFIINSFLIGLMNMLEN